MIAASEILFEISYPDQSILLDKKFILVCGDLNQPLQNCAESKFMFKKTYTINGYKSMDLWNKFKFMELDQVVHKIFVKLVNKIRLDQIDQNVKSISKPGFIRTKMILVIPLMSHKFLQRILLIKAVG